MRRITQAIKWVKNNKTYTATLCMMGGIFVTEVVVGIWHYEPVWVLNTAKTFEWFGLLLGGVGLAHKKIKGEI